MKRVKKHVFFIVAFLILALTLTSVFGIAYTDGRGTKHTILKGIGDIRWGIDIRGGVDVTFTPSPPLKFVWWPIISPTTNCMRITAMI